MENLSRRLSGLSDKSDAYDLFKILSDVYNRLNSVTLTSGGLAIKAGSSALAKTASAALITIKGVMRSFGAADMPALTGIILTLNYNVAVFSVDSAGTSYTDMGTAAASVVGVKFPNLPATRTILGFVLIYNGAGTTFTCGTTALDAASVTTTYVNTLGAFDPNAVVQ